MFLKDDKFEFEDEKFKYYTNTATEILTKQCTSSSKNWPKLIGYKCYLLESKENGEKIFVLYNKKGEPVADSYQLDGLGVEIDIMRFMKKR